MDSSPKPVLRIANCSGFYGDRLSAAREMVEGGPIDFLTGDYLAELTLLILWRMKQKDAGAGYARTFLQQMEEVLGTCLDRGIKVVTNAWGCRLTSPTSRGTISSPNFPSSRPAARSSRTSTPAVRLLRPAYSP